MTDPDKYIKDRDKPQVYAAREAAKAVAEAKAAEEAARRTVAPISVGNGRIYHGWLRGLVR